MDTSRDPTRAPSPSPPNSASTARPSPAENSPPAPSPTSSTARSRRRCAIAFPSMTRTLSTCISPSTLKIGSSSTSSRNSRWTIRGRSRLRSIRCIFMWCSRRSEGWGVNDVGTSAEGGRSTGVISTCRAPRRRGTRRAVFQKIDSTLASKFGWLGVRPLRNRRQKRVWLSSAVSLPNE